MSERKARLDKSVIDMVYPVGAIYMSVNSTNPGNLFGGKWEQIKDRFLLAAGDTYANGSTGGEATHKLTGNEMPVHSHEIAPLAEHYASAWGDSSDNTKSFNLGDISKNYGGAKNRLNTVVVGGDMPHNNMPPYLTVYIWKRTA